LIEESIYSKKRSGGKNEAGGNSEGERERRKKSIRDETNREFV
jgi:hypothetical protein